MLRVGDGYRFDDSTMEIMCVAVVSVEMGSEGKECVDVKNEVGGMEVIRQALSPVSSSGTQSYFKVSSNEAVGEVHGR
jgi:hypothetical protein